MSKFIGTINNTQCDVIEAPLWYHTRGLMQTATGYGKKLTTQYKIRMGNKFYRVYCCIFSNIGTLYIVSKKKDIIVDIDRV